MDSWTEFLDAGATRWIAGYAAAAIVALGAWRLRALTRSGVVGAILVGGSIVAAAGWWPGLVLVGFFVTASALSLATRSRSANDQARGARRDIVQVLANGGLPALLAVIGSLSERPAPWLVAMVASVAGATADTWGTETGRVSRSRPRMITSGQPVVPGTSGAISAAGTIGSFAGALLIALIAASGSAFGWRVPGITASELIAIVTLAGFMGSLADSILGATLQARFWCDACQVSTERLIHTCGTTTTLQRGRRWMDNDTVNLLAIAASAIAGVAATVLRS